MATNFESPDLPARPRRLRWVATTVATLPEGDHTDPATPGLQLRVRTKHGTFSRTWLLRYRWGEVHDLDSKTLALLTHVAVVRIHPFVDGNGRATRLLADLALAASTAGDPQRFDWNIDRRAYIAALVHYDNGRDLTPLAELVQAVPA